MSSHQINEHFMITVPFARPVNPVTHMDWEGVGVEPDVNVRAEDAPVAAEQRLRLRLQQLILMPESDGLSPRVMAWQQTYDPFCTWSCPRQNGFSALPHCCVSRAASSVTPVA